MFAENGGKVKSWPQSNSSVVDGVRVWKVSYAVNGTMGLRNLTFKTSVNDSTMGDGKSAKILIVDSVPAVSAAAFKESKAGRCWDATLVATTNADATQLKMYTEAGALTKTWTASDSNSKVVGTERIWTVTHAFTGVGSRTMTFKATKDGSTMGQGQSAKIEIVSDYVNQNEQKVAIVLEDSESDLNTLWKKYPKLRSKFLNVIHISKYDDSELVKLAESYAKRRGYDVSEEVRTNVLKEVFKKRMESGKDVNYEDVMAVIDEAVVKLEKRNMKNLFMTVLDNAYTEASMCTLIPEDFN